MGADAITNSIVPIIVGIDLGKSVAVACVNRGKRSGHYVKALGKDVDGRALRELLLQLKPTLCYMEKVGAMPAQGSVSGFVFGESVGFAKGVLAGLQIPFKLVQPQAWKKRIFEGKAWPETYKAQKPAAGLKGLTLKAFLKVEKAKVQKSKEARKSAQKQAAVEFVKKHFPDVNLVPEGCRVENHNIADATCIAAYGTLIEIGHV